MLYCDTFEACVIFTRNIAFPPNMHVVQQNYPSQEAIVKGGLISIKPDTLNPLKFLQVPCVSNSPRRLPVFVVITLQRIAGIS